MGNLALLGTLVSEFIGFVGDLKEANREKIVAKIRQFADGIEREDLVPQEAIDRAQATQDRLDAIRDKLSQ